ncbi:MAG: hypothetical protein ABW321_01470 [Polyangiales bacterium]
MRKGTSRSQPWHANAGWRLAFFGFSLLVACTAEPKSGVFACLRNADCPPAQDCNEAQRLCFPRDVRETGEHAGGNEMAGAGAGGRGEGGRAQPDPAGEGGRGGDAGPAPAGRPADPAGEGGGGSGGQPGGADDPKRDAGSSDGPDAGPEPDAGSGSLPVAGGGGRGAPAPDGGAPAPGGGAAPVPAGRGSVGGAGAGGAADGGEPAPVGGGGAPAPFLCPTGAMCWDFQSGVTDNEGYLWPSPSGDAGPDALPALGQLKTVALPESSGQQVLCTTPSSADVWPKAVVGTTPNEPFDRLEVSFDFALASTLVAPATPVVIFRFTTRQGDEGGEVNLITYDGALLVEAKQHSLPDQATIEPLTRLSAPEQMTRVTAVFERAEEPCTVSVTYGAEPPKTFAMHCDLSDYQIEFGLNVQMSADMRYTQAYSAYYDNLALRIDAPSSAAN